MNLVGIDTGGTFTDFVHYCDGELRLHKVLSTPSAPEQAILQGLREMAIDFNDLKIIHGSTVATNAVLEGKGVKTAYITNRGLKDVLLIGRQARAELYNLQPQKKLSLIQSDWCLETGGRLSATGECVEELTEQDIELLLTQLKQLDPDAVAINLLFSFLDEGFEKKIEAAMPKHLFVSRSSFVLPEYKEYERGMTTWLNSYIGPLVQNYLSQLSQQVQPAKLSIMLSAGGTATAAQAGCKAVNMLLSGPAGGLQAASYIGQQLNEVAMLSFDMGGTSTDVALINGEIKLTNEALINNLPVAIPMVDMHTIGAGGGSIAYVDEGGLLQVGPRSAGANPGPACYANGGAEVTVTDANLVMGFIPHNIRLGGHLQLDKSLALRVMKVLADELHCTTEQAAQGILQIANEHMAQALRVISVQKGFDPRDFILLSFGGAGALHVCDLAEIMSMKKALVPLHAGVFSALGMLVAPVSRELSLTHLCCLHQALEPQLERLFQRLEQQGIDEMLQEGFGREQLQLRRSVDLRYRGQSFNLNVAWRSITACIQLFHETHHLRYGHTLEEEVELVNLRLTVKSPGASLSWKKIEKKTAAMPINKVKIVGHDSDVPVFNRIELACEQVIGGPAIILEDAATIFIKQGWLGRVHPAGHLQLERIPDSAVDRSQRL